VLAAEQISSRYLLLFVVAGIWGIAAGILFRMGRLRGMARYYGDPVFPYFARNVAFSQIPGGIMFLLWAAAGLLWSRSEPVAVGLFLVGLLSGVVSWLMTLDPPEWLKPQWMREGEPWNGPVEEHGSVTYD
jgi:hypothetical protein